LAWGIVPTTDDATVAKEDAGSLRAKLDGLVDHFAGKGIDRGRIEEQMLLTPSCGMGTLKIESAEKVLEMLRELGASVG
jgi:hypothetical protein